MGSIVYPFSLTANTPENVNQLNSNLNAITAQVNGNLDEVSNVPNLAAAFTTYKTHLERAAAAPASTVDAASTYVLVAAGTVPFKISNANAYTGVFYFDPADWTANARTTKLRLRAALITNGVATTVTTTVGLYPSSSVSSGAITAGTVITGSTIAFASPAINSQFQGSSGDFTAPAAGYYFLGFVTTGNYAASSGATIAVQIQVRQV